jgi:two-component system, NtrC family, response regulator
MPRILLIDDDSNLREVAGFILAEAGHEVVPAENGQAGLDRLGEDPDLVLTDIQMPGIDGMEVLRKIRATVEPTPPPVIVLTAHGTVEQAVEAMRAGAFTYILKPFDRQELLLTVEQALRTRRLEQDNRRLRGLLESRGGDTGLIHTSKPMVRFVEALKRSAPSEATVLITGQSGTGKELAARACHDLSARWDKPFVPVNCGAIPETLMESELFGHAKGAFTGAGQSAMGKIRQAHGGTLFLDEIAELPLALQPKLLRVLESKCVDPVGAPDSVAVDFRLVCATNRDLEKETTAGRFREDLLYRISVLLLHIPSLQERPADVPLLWDHFTVQHGGPELRSEPELLAALAERSWRGNVRELKNLNQRLVLMRQEDVLTRDDLERLAPDTRPAHEPSSSAEAGADGAILPLGPLPAGGLSLIELEKEVIRRALDLCSGNRSKTAVYLGIPRHVLVYRLEKYDLK